MSTNNDVTRDFRTAPTSEDFKTALVNFKEGRSSGKMQRWKLRKMKFCLAEAERERVRRLIRMAKSLTLHQDGHKGRLAVRVQLCGEDLEPHFVFLGIVNLVKLFKTNALGIKAATVHVMKKICTKHADAPYTTKKGEIDWALFQHACRARQSCPDLCVSSKSAVIPDKHTTIVFRFA